MLSGCLWWIRLVYFRKNLSNLRHTYKISESKYCYSVLYLGERIGLGTSGPKTMHTLAGVSLAAVLQVTHSNCGCQVSAETRKLTNSLSTLMLPTHQV